MIRVRAAENFMLEAAYGKILDSAATAQPDAEKG